MKQGIRLEHVCFAYPGTTRRVLEDVSLELPPGAVVAIVSSGGNGHYDPNHPAAGCQGQDTFNMYTRLAPFSRLIRQAFKEAGAAPKLE